jgi:Mrp family chromosome partitioning ATPase
MDRIERALDLSRRLRAGEARGGVSFAERPELLRSEPPMEPERHEPPPPPGGGTIELPGLTGSWVEPPERLAIDRRELGRRRIVLPDDRGPAARAYRMLRAQVLQHVRAHGLRAIGIVSAVAGEGKTVSAINLAMSLAAEPNQDVTLVDLDLRRPTMATTLGIRPPRGIDLWLSTNSPPAELAFRLEGIERLRVISTLAPVVASSEALAGERIRGLFAGLRARHAAPLIVVDQAPALLSDDVLTLAPQLDGYILVVTEHRTNREDVGRVFELLGRERLIGTVLNHSADSEQRAY